MGRRVPTSRTAPVVDGAAGRLAQTLRREAEDGVDEISQARLERSLYEAWRAGAVAEDPARKARAGRRRRARATWGASVAVAAAAGALIAFGVLDEPALAPYASGAHYELRMGDGGMQRGTVHPGETLKAGPLGHVDVELGYSRVEIARSSAVRFDRMSAKTLQMSVVEGRIDVDFHPPAKGVQTLAVQTRAARVLVVGTRFSVEVDARGDTSVVVAEGIVEVVPRAGGETRRVAAGESVSVLVDPGDAVERAVRDALTDELAEPDLDLSGVDELVEPVAPQNTPLAEEPPRPSARELRLRSERLLTSAREQLRAGKHQPARRALLGVAQGDAHAGVRAEAHTLLAESFTAQGDIPGALAAYRDAARVGSSLPVGHNAVFALARVLERYQQDRDGARAAFEQYLQRAPRGALASQARAGLCRLGDSASCQQQP